MYWDTVSKLVMPGGLLVITSCNNTKDELMQEVDEYNHRAVGASLKAETTKDSEAALVPLFRYLNHVRTYPTFMFGGSVGSVLPPLHFSGAETVISFVLCVLFLVYAPYSLY